MNNDFQGLKIRKAGTRDLPTILGIVEGCGLPTKGLADHLKHFFVGEVKEQIVGAVGLEIYQTQGLLRSAAVVKDFQHQGIGGVLVDTAVRYAGEQGITDLLLLTTTAKDYFRRKGFTVIDRSLVGGDILSSEEFGGACPSTATVMHLHIA